MASWQRKARMLIAVGATAFAVVVAFAFRPRVEAPPPEIITTDPAAVIETSGGRITRTNRNKEESRIQFERQSTYADGTSRGTGVSIVIPRGGKTYEIFAKEGEQQGTSKIFLKGEVRMAVSDGLTVYAEQATYDSETGILEVPGPVKFTRGRMTGTSEGMTFRDHDQVMVLPKAVAIDVKADDQGAGAMQMKAGSAEVIRPERTIRLAGGVTTSRPTGRTQSETAVARLTVEEDRIEHLELRGRSQLLSPSAQTGAMQSVTGRDIDLAYAPDGQTLQRVVVVGDSQVTFAGERGRGGRQILSDRLAIELSATNGTPTNVNAQGRVRVTLPAEGTALSRTITAQDFIAEGNEEKGLTSGRFTGGVEFTENGGRAPRTATSTSLNLVLGGGLNAIEEAQFSGNVIFNETATQAKAAQATYRLKDESLSLSGGGPPRLVQERLSVEASRIDLNLTRKHIVATGNVKSELQPRQGRGGADAAKLPSLLSEESPVNVTAGTMNYNGETESATYGGGVRLWQVDGDDTAIKSQTLTLDETSGNLTAVGSVITDVTLDQVSEDGKKERMQMSAKAERLVYDDATRRATYTGSAEVNGLQGRMNADRVDIYLRAQGRELDRMEAHDKIALESEGKRARGAQLTYQASDQSYVVVGLPAVVTDACGETEGKMITFFKSTDRMIVDGVDGRRPRTRGTTGCQ